MLESVKNEGEKRKKTKIVKRKHKKEKLKI